MDCPKNINNFQESKKLFLSPLESEDEGNETTDENKLWFCLFLNFNIYIEKALEKKNNIGLTQFESEASEGRSYLKERKTFNIHPQG